MTIPVPTEIPIEDITGKEMLRFERNIMLLPIFTFGSYKVAGEVVKLGSKQPISIPFRTIDGAKSQITINFNEGRPGEQDYVLFRRVEQIALSYASKGVEIPKELYVGTIKSLGQGLNRNIVQLFIDRMIGVQIIGKCSYFISKHVYDVKTGKAQGYFVKETRATSIYDAGKTIAPVESKEGSDKTGVYITLSDSYRINLQNYYTKSIYCELLNTIKHNMSKRLAEFLIMRDYSSTPYFNYSEVCNYLQMTHHKTRGEMKKQVEKLFGELEKQKVAIWKNYANPTLLKERVNGKRDWQLQITLRPLLTPAMINRQLDSKGAPNEKETIKLFKKIDALKQENQKVRLSPVDTMIYEAYTEYAARQEQENVKTLKNEQLKAIRQAIANSRSQRKLESYDRHLSGDDIPY